MKTSLFSAAVYATNPKALLYRDNGPVGCVNCSEPFYNILSSLYDIQYVGPNEAIKEITEEALKGVSLYIQPGGGGYLDVAWNVMCPSRDALRNFV